MPVGYWLISRKNAGLGGVEAAVQRTGIAAASERISIRNIFFLADRPNSAKMYLQDRITIAVYLTDKLIISSDSRGAIIFTFQTIRAPLLIFLVGLICRFNQEQRCWGQEENSDVDRLYQMQVLDEGEKPVQTTFTNKVTRFYHIQVLDEKTGIGVPLVELRTTNDIRYFSDSLGNIAFFEPDLMDQEIYFHVQSHGYEFPKDGFGYRGRTLKPVAGEKAVLKIKRINLAERLFRVTGAGIYRDSYLLDLRLPVEEPLLNGKVFGSDSVVNAIYNDKLYWFWGDTNRPSYPLGLFHVPGATSDVPADLSPEHALNVQYFLAEDGFVKAMAKMPGEGPTWISGLSVVKDQVGRERMLATYVKVRGQMEIYQRGLVGFNDQREEFEKLAQFDVKDPLYPDGHTVISSDHGQENAYFATPYPLVRVKANYDSMLDLRQYESFSYFKEGSRRDRFELERDGQGKLVLQWRRDTLPLSEKLEAELIKAGKIRPDEAYFQLRDVDTGDRVQLSSGSVYWNEYRRKWVMIAVQAFGKPSFLGEVWLSEADELVGPWQAAKRIVTHDHYSFYNPKQHPYFDQDGGRVIFFEGTYTDMFSSNKDPTPRYNYNQIMYRLDLSDPRLFSKPVNGDER